MASAGGFGLIAAWLGIREQLEEDQQQKDRDAHQFMMRIKIADVDSQTDANGAQSPGYVLRALSMSTSEDGARIRKQAMGPTLKDSGSTKIDREENTGQRADSEKSMVIALTTYNPEWTILLNFEADFDRGQQLDSKNW